MIKIFSQFLVFCFTTSVFAEQKEFTILGGEKIRTEVEQGMPLPAEKDGIKIQEAAFMIDNGKLIFVFGFFSKKEIKKVVVEDVSGKNAVTLVEDTSPKLQASYWRNTAFPLSLSKKRSAMGFRAG